jgi:outer membrane protein insertion porin family
MRGFDVRGIGPRVERVRYITATELDDDEKNIVSDALGGRAYYFGRLEVEFPQFSGLKSLGLRPSAFVDVGSVFGLKKPRIDDIPGTCFARADDDPNTETPAPVRLDPGQVETDCPLETTTPEPTDRWAFIPGYKEFYRGDSPKPRLSVGIGVNWVSPFGPLRIDIAKALLKQKGDDTKLFSFNVGTQF